VNNLRKIAKRKNMVGYYKLRKADLITVIRKHGGGIMDNKTRRKSICTILQSPIMTYIHPILTPNKYIPPAK